METCPVCAHAMQLEEAAPTIIVCARCATPFVPERTTGTQLPPELSARYRLETRVGAGAMGTVYRACALADGAPVAVKLLTRSDHPDAHARFMREARLLLAVRHPNVVAVREVAEVDGHPFLVTEFVPGGTLRERLDRGGALEPGAAVALACQVLDGLAACHDAGIVHRDVKPANLLLDGPVVKVADFGVARGPNDQRLTRTGARLGSPTYMSPEQARGEPAGAPADVYSTAVVLYEMLAGRPPFEEPSVPALLAAQQAKVPAPLPARVPAAVSAAVMAALAKDPARRPSARGFAEALLKPTPARAHGPWAVLSVFTFVGLMLLAAMPTRAPEPAPPATARATPRPSASAAPAVTAQDDVRALLAAIDLAPVELKPWSAGASEVDCPLVLVCADHVERLRVQATGCRVIEVNGVALENTLVAPRGEPLTVLSPVAHRLHDGLNWVRLRVEPGAVPRATVYPDRQPCAVPMSNRTPPEVAAYDRVNVQLFGRVPADTAAGRAAVAREYPAGDPRALAALVRVSAVEDDFLDNMAGVVEQVTDDPVWTDPAKLELCRKGADTLQVALSANPQAWEYWNDLGYLMRKCGQQTAARAALVRALTLWPGAFWSWRELGLLGRRQFRESKLDENRKEAVRCLRYAQRFYLSSGLSIFWVVSELDGALAGLGETH